MVGGWVSGGGRDASRPTGAVSEWMVKDVVIRGRSIANIKKSKIEMCDASASKRCEERHTDTLAPSEVFEGATDANRSLEVANEFPKINDLAKQRHGRR
jgi:hypothetical protein